jgi:hypothetical protein
MRHVWQVASRGVRNRRCCAGGLEAIEQLHQDEMIGQYDAAIIGRCFILIT